MRTRFGGAPAATYLPSRDTANAEASGSRSEIVRVIRPLDASRRVSRPSGSRTAKDPPSGKDMTKPNPPMT